MKTRRPSFCLSLALTALALLSALPPQFAHAQKSKPTSKPPKSKFTSPKSDSLDVELQTALKAAPTQKQWPNNNYARLLDLGNVTVKSDGTMIAEYRLTTKLFNENARELAEVNLPYNDSYQAIRVIRARTIKKDGTIVNVKSEDIRESAPYGEYLMYDDAKAISFSMPAVEDDCIIDYTWQEITRPLLMPGQFWTHWSFSGQEPSALSRYVLTAPADKKFNFKVYNDDTLKPLVVTSKDGRTTTYTWERKDLKPIEVEPAMPSPTEITTWMEISSIKSWADIGKWYWDLQKSQTAATPAIRTTVNKLIADKKTDEDKARAIYDWVANKTRYVGLEFGISAYKPHAAAEVHDKLYGDCKDKATMLITMLGLAGIKAHPVLLHADDRRESSKGLPTLDDFNHCIALAEVSGKEVWLDGTAETCAFGDIPNSDRGVEAFVVRDGVGVFQKIPTYKPEENGQSSRTLVALKPDGSAEMQYELTLRGAVAQYFRATVRSLLPDKRKEMVQQMVQRSNSGGKLVTYDLPDGAQKEGPYILKIAMTAPNYAKKVGSLLLIPLGGSAARQSPFSKETRQYPIVDENIAMTQNEIVLNLPEGFAIEEAAGDVNLACPPLQEYKRTITKAADNKTITITEQTVTRGGRVPAADYAKIRAYNEQILKSVDDQIVLRKPKT